MKVIMYHVIIVDDEPAALKHIRTIIELKCPGFKIVGTAENGKEALEKIEELRPDVVVTDVKMPVMDGITLARKVKEKYSEILMLIISGYEEFSYVRDAMRSGVYDYILKPVKPSTFQESMRILQGRLDEIYYEMRNQMIREMCTGILPDSYRFRRIFSEDQYYVALFRKNGLPRRFVTSKGIEIFSIKDEQIMIYGRDEMEELYICPQKLLFHNSFYQLMTHVINKEKKTTFYYTMVLYEDAVSVCSLPEIIKKLYRTLDHKLIIGKSQLVVVDREENREEKKKENGEYVEELGCLEFFLQEHSIHKALNEVKNYFERWKEREYNQLCIEDQVRKIFGVFRKYRVLDESVEMCEYFMDEAFFYASSMDELAENIFQILYKGMKDETIRIKVDTPEFFEKIQNYMKEHLSEQLSPQVICDIFGISQTYLSRLFRKYSHMGFNKSLNYFRIERAKEIMRKEGLFIKDVASMVGYSDQFYFSRIFRSITGCSPSEYIESNK